MSKVQSSLKTIGFTLATTVGAGIFALPYIFQQAGWATGFFYLLIFSFLVAAAHFIYLRVLNKTEAKDRLLGFAKKHLGRGGFGLAFFAVVGGLILSLVAYLILGSHFLKLIFPGMGEWVGVIVFWVLGSAPLSFKPKRFLLVELLGGLALAGLIIFILLSVWPVEVSLSAKVFDPGNLFLPFGVVLFSLAGWTAVEPVFESRKKSGDVLRHGFRDFSIGALLSSLIYLVFVLVIFSSAEELTPDTVSGLGNWARWRMVVLGAFGLFTLWTSYLPIATEVKNLFERDLKWRKAVGEGVVIALPILLVAAGLNNFLGVVGLVGGVFLALQYLLIVAVGQKILKFGFWGMLLAIILDVVFAAAAVYEIYHFVVK